MKINNQSTNFDDYLKSKLQDKEIKKEYDKLEPEFTAEHIDLIGGRTHGTDDTL